MNTETLDKFHRAINMLYDIEIDLTRRSDGFEITGNEYMASSLLTMAIKAKHCHELISEALGETIGDIIKDTDAANRNMIEAALATIVHNDDLAKAQLETREIERD